MLPNAVPNTFQDAKSEQEGAAGIPPVKELLSLQCFFPCLAAAAFLKTKSSCSQLGPSFFVTAPQHNL